MGAKNTRVLLRQSVDDQQRGLRGRERSDDQGEIQQTLSQVQTPLR
jgi:hypothetical protein